MLRLLGVGCGQQKCVGVVVDKSVARVHFDRQVEKRQRFSDVLLDELHLLGAPDGDQHSSELTSLCLGVVDQHGANDVAATVRSPLILSYP